MDILQQTIDEIAELEKKKPEGGHIVTGEIRKLSSSLFRKIEDKSIDNVLLICETLLEQHSWPIRVIAFDFAYRVRRQYDLNTYTIFYRWLKDYVCGWGDCDDFCTHAFGELLRQQKSIFSIIMDWTQDKDFWVRRASAVILIPSILKDDLTGIDPIAIADRLLMDEHDLVLKGYGWMLKSLSLVNQDKVEVYLKKNSNKMPRVAFRYALEKFEPEKRKELLHGDGASVQE